MPRPWVGLSAARSLQVRVSSRGGGKGEQEGEQ